MTLDSRIKKALAVGAVCSALIFNPVSGAQEAYAQVDAKKTEYIANYNNDFIRKCSDIYDSLIKKYDEGTAKAIFASYARGTDLDTARSDAFFATYNVALNKFPAEVKYSVIRNSNSIKSFKKLVKLVESIDQRLMDTQGISYDREKASADIGALIDATGVPIARYEPSRIVSTYLESDFSPIDNGTFVKAMNSTSEKPEELLRFGKYLVDDKKYSEDIAGAVLLSYAQGVKDKEEIVAFADLIAEKGYASRISEGMILAYGQRTHMFSNLGGTIKWERNSPEDLIYIADNMIGKYDDDVIASTVLAFAKLR